MVCGWDAGNGFHISLARAQGRAVEGNSTVCRTVGRMLRVSSVCKLSDRYPLLSGNCRTDSPLAPASLSLWRWNTLPDMSDSMHHPAAFLFRVNTSPLNAPRPALARSRSADLAGSGLVRDPCYDEAARLRVAFQCQDAVRFRFLEQLAERAESVARLAETGVAAFQGLLDH